MSLENPSLPLSQLLPHAPPMVFLNRLVEEEANGLRVAEARVDDISLFRSSSGHLPAWVGLELMAQTLAAHAGSQDAREGREPRIGFLVGTRSYTCHVSAFSPGQGLRIEVEKEGGGEGGMGIFRGRILDAGDGRCLTEARFQVYLPENPSHMLEEPT